MNYINPFNQLSGIFRKAKQNTTLSQETIKKMSEAKKGKPWSEKRRAAYLKKTYNEQIS